MKRKAAGQKTWVDQSNNEHFIWAVMYNLSIIFPLGEAIREFKKTRNIAWFYHPLISFLTIVIYAYIFLGAKLKFYV